MGSTEIRKDIVSGFSTEANEENLEEFDDVLDLIGSSGRYQKFLLYGALVPISFILALLSYSGLYTLYIPDHHCSPGIPMDPDQLKAWKLKHIPKIKEPDGSDTFSSCEMYNLTLAGEPWDKATLNASRISCQNGWIFSKTEFDHTIPTDYAWACDKNFYPTTAFSVGAAGSFVGNVVFGPLADKFGRKPILFSSLTIYFLFVMFSYFVPHLYAAYLGVIFVASTGFPMIYSLPPLLMAELCNNEYRAWTFTVSWVAWVFGMAAIPWVAYFARDWFLLGLSVNAPAFLIFLLYPLCPESPRWLVSMGRVEEAVVIMRKVARVNKTLHKMDENEMEKVLRKISILEREKVDKVLGFWTLFSTKHLTLITCLISFTCTAHLMIYEQITLNTPYMSGNQFLNFFLLAIVELPGSVLAGFMIGRLGRRWTPVIFGMLMAVSCLVAGILAPFKMSILVIACIIIAKFCVTITLYVIDVQSVELFPTPLRVTGGAVKATIASCFGLLNPSIVYTGKIYAGAPYLVMFLISFAGTITASFLPETHRQHLPETIEDASTFGKGNRYWSLHPKNDQKRKKSLQVGGNHIPTENATLVGSGTQDSNF